VFSSVRHVEICGVRVCTAHLDLMAAAMVRWAQEEVPPAGPRYVCATSAHGVVESADDPAFREILNRATAVVPDGMPLVWLGRLVRRADMSLVPGPTLMAAVCAQSAATPVRHFFYGGQPGVADRLSVVLPSRFPGLRVAGSHCPPFRPLTSTERTDVADRINGSGAGIVWVGLSTPKQERWIAEIRDQLRTPVLCSVGAAFDFLTGRARQPPEWVQQAGLGWLFRLAQEPRRLWRRYARTNPRFVWLAGRQLLRRD
jgi:N-acetylglucosaminyldiphosphoundecaprenol N-acetyl-beta-D-mannosaminyltransferase